jgi:hypothetical protein
MATKRFVVRFIPVNDRGYRIGQYHHRAKLTEVQIDRIFEMRDEGMSYRAIAEQIAPLVAGGIARETVRDVCRGLIRGQMGLRVERRMVQEVVDDE